MFWVKVSLGQDGRKGLTLDLLYTIFAYKVQSIGKYSILTTFSLKDLER